MQPEKSRDDSQDKSNKPQLLYKTHQPDQLVGYLRISVGGMAQYTWIAKV